MLSIETIKTNKEILIKDLGLTKGVEMDVKC